MSNSFQIQGEKEAVLECIRLAKIYGYGNLIAHLRRYWAIHLIDSGIDDGVAIEATDVSPYPVDQDYLGIKWPERKMQKRK